MPPSVLPELSVPCDAPFDSSNWSFGVDWEGARAILFADTSGAVRLQGERFQDLGVIFPELLAVGDALSGRACVLDGVITVLDSEGRPDIAAVGARLTKTATPAELPAVYLATDLLHRDAEPLVRLPLRRRLTALSEFVDSHPCLQVPDLVDHDGRAIADAASQRSLAAVLARAHNAPYRPGVASPDRLRIPLRHRSTVAVLGVAPVREGWQQRRLMLAERVDGRWRSAGVVTAPLSPAVADWLDAVATENAGSRVRMGWSAPVGTRWMAPHLTATVDHQGRDGGGEVLAPHLLAIRDDVDPASCVRRAPVPPPPGTEQTSPFAPVVLSGLPFADPVR